MRQEGNSGYWSLESHNIKLTSLTLVSTLSKLERNNFTRHVELYSPLPSLFNASEIINLIPSFPVQTCIIGGLSTTSCLQKNCNIQNGDESVSGKHTTRLSWFSSINLYYCSAETKDTFPFI